MPSILARKLFGGGIVNPPASDTTAPSVSTFTVSDLSTSLAVPVAAFIASEDGALFLITENSTP